MGQNNDGVAVKKDERELKLIAFMAIRGLSQTDQIALLHKAGFTPKGIAEIIGTTSNTVRVALVSIRRAAAQGKKRGRAVKTHKEDDHAKEK